MLKQPQISVVGIMKPKSIGNEKKGENADYVDQSIEHAFVRTRHSMGEELV